MGTWLWLAAVVLRGVPATIGSGDLPQGTGAGPSGGAAPEFRDVIVDPQMAGDCKMAGDIDGDGLVDGVVGGAPGEDLAWYRWPDWTRTRIATAQEQFTTDGELADIDGDGDLDVVIADGPSGTNLHWFRNPRPGGNPADPAQWARVPIGEVGYWCKDIEPRDYDRDGLMDVACRRDLEAMVFFQRPGGTWERATLTGGLFGEGMAAGDVDGDGDADVVLPGFWLENPEPGADAATAPWARFTIDGGTPNDVWILVADIDGAAGAEVLFSSSEGVGPVRWYAPSAGDPGGAWAGHDIVGSIGGCHTLQAGDMDRDGRVDVVLAQMHTFAPREVLVAYNNGGAQSWTVRAIASTGLHNGVLADFGGDGDLDLFGCNWTGNPPVRLFENLGGGCPEDVNGDGTVNSSDISSFLTIWLESIGQGTLVADWNGDGVTNSADISAFLTSWLDAINGGC